MKRRDIENFENFEDVIKAVVLDNWEGAVVPELSYDFAYTRVVENNEIFYRCAFDAWDDHLSETVRITKNVSLEEVISYIFIG